jgi:hypothetical protein
MWNRSQRIVAFVTVAVVVGVSLAWFGWFTAPAQAPTNVSIVSVQNLPLQPGLTNAVVFPFQLDPNAQPNEEGIPSVTSAGISLTFSEPACDLDAGHTCPGIAVGILVSGGPTNAGNLDPVWCAQFDSNATSCLPTANGTFQVSLTDYAGEPLDLIVWTPSGVGWADVTATGSWVD